jgi:hypothetical protein
MLLKRFASRIEGNGEKQFIWRYQQGRQPFELSTKDAGVAKDFYGEDDDELENKLMEVEGAYASALREIDAGTFAFDKRSAFLADMVWLFALRTEANRIMLTAFVQSAMQEVANQLPSEAAKEFLARNLNAMLEERLKAAPHLSSIFADPQFNRQIDHWKNEVLDELQGHLGGLAEYVMNDPEAKKAFIVSQNEGLSGRLAADTKCPISRAPLNWHTVVSQNDELVLGDACVFAVNGKGQAAPFVGGEDLQLVCFPISPRMAIVGLFDRDAQELEPQTIRRHSIAFSSRYFFSNRNDEALARDCNLIMGTEASFLKNGDERAIITNLWTGDVSKSEELE